MTPDTQSGVAFVAAPEVGAAIEIRVNFGIFAGRSVMLAEIDRLAAWILDEVEAVTIIAEDRHQIGRTGEGSVHQVRIEVDQANAPAGAAERRELEQRLLARVDHWARLCIAERHSDLADADD